MQDLKALLARYAHVGVSDKRKKEVIQNVLQTEFKIPVVISSIHVEQGRIRVHVPAAVRYVLHEKKKDVLARINTDLGPHDGVVDIC